MPERPLPHDKAAEESVLGACLQNEHAMEHSANMLTPEDFYDRQHAEVFGVMLSLYQAGSSIDLVTVSGELGRQGVLEAVGGVNRLAGFISLVPAPSMIGSYTGPVKSMATRRRLIGLSLDLAQRCQQLKENPDACIAHAFEGLMEIEKGQGQSMGEVPTPAQLAEGLLREQEEEVKSVSTSFSWLDSMTGGLMPGRLYTIAGRTSAGKSAIAQQIATAAASKAKVLYISLEMPPKELLSRRIATETGIAVRDIELHRVSPLLRVDMEKSLEEYAKSKLYFTSAGYDIPSIERIVRMEKPGLLVIDTVNLVKGQGESERVKILSVTRSLKQLALALRIPIVITAQLSRSVDNKDGPGLSDIKESASIEEDSDVVLTLFAITSGKKLEDYSQKNHVETVSADDFVKIKAAGDRVVIAHIQKNRSGPIGQTAYRFAPKRFFFEEIGEVAPKQTTIPGVDDDDLPF